MIITEGLTKIAVIEDEPTAAYRVESVSRATRPGSREHSNRCGPRHGGVVCAPRGMLQRALLGGAFRPDAGKSTVFEVVVVGPDVALDGEPTCDSHLGKPLVAGLIEEFADAALAGVSGDGLPGLPAGILRVDRAGCSAEGSSSHIFRLAGQLLHRVLASQLTGDDVEVQVREFLPQLSRRRG